MTYIKGDENYEKPSGPIMGDGRAECALPMQFLHECPPFHL